jgi:hypothetical protein
MPAAAEPDTFPGGPISQLKVLGGDGVASEGRKYLSCSEEPG